MAHAQIQREGGWIASGSRRDATRAFVAPVRCSVVAAERATYRAAPGLTVGVAGESVGRRLAPSLCDSSAPRSDAWRATRYRSWIEMQAAGTHVAPLGKPAYARALLAGWIRGAAPDTPDEAPL